MLFHRVGEILIDVGKRFQSVSEAGKPILNSLPNRRRSYAVADSPSLVKPVAANPAIPRLIGSVASSKNLNFSFGECTKVEGVAKQGLKAQSMAYWLFSGILNWVKNEGFKPGEPQYFEELIQSFSLAMVNCTNALASIATFVQSKRREGTLAHFPAHVGEHHKAQLQASSFEGNFLFDEEVLRKALAESREDSAVSANVAISKGFNFPVFGKGGKVTETKVASPIVPKGQSAQRGKGKSGFWQKRKAQSQSQGNPKSPKSAKTGSSGSSSGKGFQK